LPTGDKDYGKFLEELELIGLGLKSCSTMLDRRGYWAAHKKGSKAVREFTQRYRLTHFEKDFLEAEGHFALTVSEGKAKAVALKLECVFDVHMHLGPSARKDLAERFTLSELRLVLVPYARLFVSSMTAQMQIPPIIIPLSTAI
jgi:hypothetical protein